MIDAFYGDGTGVCMWCKEVAVVDYFGVPLCDKHEAEEVAKDLGGVWG